MHVVPCTSAYQSETSTCIYSMLEALSDVHMLDPELRQLWLEIHWLKSDYDQGILNVPTGWEPMIFQVARGQLPASFRRYPNIVSAAEKLGAALKNQLKRTS